MKTTKQSNADRKKYWLWVTQPEHYLDDDGRERRDLDPSSSEDLWGTWTCNRNTKKRDLILLWRSKRNLKGYLSSLGVKSEMTTESDVAYLFQAKSDAFENMDEEEIHSPGWQYYCEMVPIYKFKTPLSISEIRLNPHLEEWGALRAKFRRSAFEISPEIWNRLNNLLMDRNPGYKRVLEKIEGKQIPIKIDLEEQIEDYLAKNPQILKRRGYDLDLIGRQIVCIGVGGRLDLLFRDKKRKYFLVVELKNIKASQSTFGQISNYIGWVKDRIAGSQSVKGLVISRGIDPQFISAMKTNPHISHLDIGVLGFK